MAHLESRHPLALLNNVQAFLAQSPDATFIVDAEGTILFVSQQAETLIGYTPAELIGEKVEKLIPTGIGDKHIKLRQSFIAAPSLRAMGRGRELHVRAKDGTEIPVEVSLSPIETKDGLLVSASLRDVAYRIEHEHELQAAKDTAEHANRAKSRFLAAASHDLRQPLQSLSAYLTVLQLQIEGEELKSVAFKMKTALKAMGGLLDALLDISQLEGGAIEPRHSNFELPTLIDAIVVNNAPAAEVKGLDLSRTGDGFVIRSDQGLLTRILDNFVSNAVRYTQSGTVRIFTEVAGDRLKISISDTGIGIPEDQVGLVFEEYYQLDNPTRDQGKGLGLGLAIVQRIATLTGHELSVESKAGAGSTFSVYVPLIGSIYGSPPKGEQLSDDTAARGETTILLVDDDPAILESMGMLLELSGFGIIAARSPAEALTHVHDASGFDVLISDYRMPGMTGVDFVKLFRSASEDEIPAIIMTGDTSADTIRRAGLPNCHVMHKPTDFEHLDSLIETITRGRS